MIPVVLESPWAAHPAICRAYLHAAIRDCLRLGETPYASHAVLIGALRDEIPEERLAGLAAGFALGDCLIRGGAVRVAYFDLGISPGMRLGIARGGRTLYRTIDPEEWPRVAAEAGFPGLGLDDLRKEMQR